MNVKLLQQPKYSRIGLLIEVKLTKDNGRLEIWSSVVHGLNGLIKHSRGSCGDRVHRCDLNDKISQS
jgi:hypothetical protein